jgi:RAQPRD family integrative conjugative element protein
VVFFCKKVTIRPRFIARDIHKMPRKKIILISILLMTAPHVNADIDAEKEKLALIVHELETITPLIAEAEILANKNDRIQLQYEWLARDIECIKSGIQAHINAPRTHPRNFPPIDRNYRR